MTKKRFSTKKRGNKKLRRKSSKMRKSIKGGNNRNHQFVKNITSCIPQDPENYSDIPISQSGYKDNDDDWTRLAKNIYDLGPIEFECNGKDAIIYGSFNDEIGFDYGSKIGTLYGEIDNSRPVILWKNGRQYTYEQSPRRTPNTSHYRSQ